MPPLCLGPKSPLCGKATVSTSPDIHFDSSCNTPDIQAAEALDQFPSDEKGLDTAAAATLDVKNSGGSSHSPSKMSAKGLRNSFRKLVKPLVKKRNTEVDEGDGDGGSEESLLSRVGSSRWRKYNFFEKVYFQSVFWGAAKCPRCRLGGGGELSNVYQLKCQKKKNQQSGQHQKATIKD